MGRCAGGDVGGEGTDRVPTLAAPARPARHRAAADLVGRGRGRYGGLMPSSSAGTRSREKLPVVAFANRLPVRRVRNSWRLAAGGLVTALRPAMEVNGGSWIGWDGGAEVPSSVEGLDIELR